MGLSGVAMGETLLGHWNMITWQLHPKKPWVLNPEHTATPTKKDFKSPRFLNQVPALPGSCILTGLLAANVSRPRPASRRQRARATPGSGLRFGDQKRHTRPICRPK